jgi:hypothetical protein
MTRVGGKTSFIVVLHCNVANVGASWKVGKHNVKQTHVAHGNDNGTTCNEVELFGVLAGNPRGDG